MANYVFGGTIKLGGAQEFKNAVSQCSESLRKMSSTLRSQTSEFSANDNSMRRSVTGQRELNSAIKSQEVALQKAKGLLASYSTEITKQTQNHNILNKEYKSAVSELNKLEKTLGTSSNEYKKQAQVVDQLGTQLSQSQAKLNDSKEAYSKLKKEINNANNTINQSKTSMNQLGKEEDSLKTKTDKASEGFTVFKGILANLGAQVITGVASKISSLGSSLVGLGKKAVSSYADYEQLVGGVETLFKSAAPQVMEFANQAYKTVGVSANQYMEQVTSFSASMISSLGGNTKKAAQLSNQALLDMGDNANKMGTDMTMIQNAYQGFAKQNYTMLDNLKLGFGGTKGEMQRLLNEAEKLTGKKYSVSSFADITEAIHAIQVQMGITGTTAKEAEQTISGSVNAMKAAWQNMLTGMADENSNFGKLVDNLTKSLVTVSKNIMPRIKIALQGIIKFLITSFVQLTPMISTMVVSLITDMVNIIKNNLPQLKQSITSVIGSLANGLKQLLPMLAGLGVEIILALASSIIQNLPSILDGITKALIEGLKSIAKSLPDLIPMIVTAILDLIEVLLDNMDVIIDVGMQIITGLIDGIIKALPILIDKLPEIIDKIISVLVENIPKILYQVAVLILKIAEAFVNAIPAILAAQWKMWAAVGANILKLIPTWLEYGKQFAMNLWNGIVSRIKSFPEAAIKGLNQFIDGLKSGFNKLWDAGVDMVNRLINGAISYFNNIWNLGKKVINLIVDSLSPLADEVWNIGSDIVRGLWNGISDAGGWLWRKVSNFASGIIDSMMSALGIHSPSTVAKEKVGKNVIYGVGDGIVENSEYVTKQLQAAIKGAVIDVVPENISTKLNVDTNAPKIQNQMLNNEYSEFASANLIRDFKSALSEMKIVLDDEVAGKFVTNTVANAIYS